MGILTTSRVVQIVSNGFRFYEMLGLKNGARPTFNFRGAWLYNVDRPVLYLVEEASDQLHRTQTGGLHHIAL